MASNKDQSPSRVALIERVKRIPVAYLRAASVSVVLIVCLSIGGGIVVRHKNGKHDRHVPAATVSSPAEFFQSLPISFEANQGQTSEQVRFLSRGAGYTLFLTTNEAVLSLRNAAKQDARDAILRMKLLGANPNPLTTGLSELPGKTNYFLGNDPRNWHRNIINYAQVRYQDVYSGVDLVYYGNDNQLEYDFRVAPGAQPKNIQLSFAGARRLHIDPQSGDLVLAVGERELRIHKPDVYQTNAAVSRTDNPAQNVPGLRKRFIEAHYVIGKHDHVGFELTSYDATKELVIDPSLTYSTYLGGTASDYGTAIAADAAGNAYVTGYTSSTKFPVTTGAFQTTCGGGCANGNTDAFVTKFDSTGANLIYSTYLGGTGKDLGNGIAVDSAGNVYVVGQTSSTNFPVTSGAFQAACSNRCLNSDAFVTELDSSGSGLVYSTYLGGRGKDQANAIALDASRNAYITGYTQSTNFPVTPGAFQSICSCSSKPDVFVAALNPTGSALVYSTYVGGGDTDVGYAIALDSSNNAYITGYTQSINFPTTAGAFQSTQGALQTAFVTKVNSTGTALLYSTYLGGSNTNTTPCEACGASIAVNSSGNAYVCGLTAESNFPITPGAFQSKFMSSTRGHDAFVTEFDTTGTGLVFSTYLGGTGDDGAVGIAVDSAGNVWLKGNTKSTDFPITTGAFQTRNAGSFDAFVSELNSTGSSLLYSTYLGGSGTEFGGATRALALDSANPYNVYVVGYTNSTNFPVTVGTFQTKLAGANDVFIAKFSSAATTKSDLHR